MAGSEATTPSAVGSVTEGSLRPQGAEYLIGIDAMGGDNAPLCVLQGADIMLRKRPNLHFILYGDQDAINRHISKFPRLSGHHSLVHTTEKVLPDDVPTVALRQRKNSGMALGIKAVRAGNIDAFVSSGNTGALMAMSKVILKTLPDIDRPAISTLVPTINGSSVMLDLGANIYCDANNLFEFAVMGDAFARVMLGLKRPKIGLLNIGSEDIKGNEQLKLVAQMLKEHEHLFDFYGNIEGDDIGKGIVDVVVTDGFSGNIALKTAEGTARLYSGFLKQAFSSSIMARLGVFFARPALRAFKKRTDPRLYNGAMFLGLGGIVVKSHGGSDGVGFANALEVSCKLVSQNINALIMEEIQRSGESVQTDINSL